MNLYRFIRPCLFFLSPEVAHQLSLKCLKLFYRLRIIKPKVYSGSSIKVLGMQFPNRVGLAAGFDRNGEYIDALSTLGFGHIEIGTVTPKAQAGKDKPRIFRLKSKYALINRMGFANKGADYVLEQLKKTRYRGILGINIGKNSDTPNDLAAEDYLYCMRKLYPYANYLTINISSPNTKNLRALQQHDLLYALLSTLKAEQHILAGKHHRYVPLLVKLAPDLDEAELASIAKVLQVCKVDGVVLSNTSLQRPLLENVKNANEIGGLSGRAITELSLESLKNLTKHLHDDLPIIALGGIYSEKTAYERIANGASLYQVYTSLVYQGPSLVKRLAKFMG